MHCQHHSYISLICVYAIGIYINKERFVFTILNGSFQEYIDKLTENKAVATIVVTAPIKKNCNI